MMKIRISFEFLTLLVSPSKGHPQGGYIGT